MFKRYIVASGIIAASMSFAGCATIKPIQNVNNQKYFYIKQCYYFNLMIKQNKIKQTGFWVLLATILGSSLVFMDEFNID